MYLYVLKYLCIYRDIENFIVIIVNIYSVHKQYNKLMNVNYHAHLMTTFYVNALQLHYN